MWDAWDVDEFYRNTVADLTEAESVEIAGSGENGAAVRVVRSFGASRVTQSLRLLAGTKRLEIGTEVDWHETEKFLKLAFPLDIHADRYAAETQFGHIFRPTHTNTSWEAAKFEACNHKFLHFAEPGWGVAVISASTYGHDVTRTVRADGGTTTTARVSLLRAPRFPDPETDQGRHYFEHALVPGASIGDAVREGYAYPTLRRSVGSGDREVEPLFGIDDDAVVASAIKLADDRSGDVVLRVYESRGGRASARIVPGFAFSGFEICDLLERPITREAVSVVADNDGLGDGVRLDLRPFQLVTLRFTRSTGSSEA
jgi:alpha-mannosidase